MPRLRGDAPAKTERMTVTVTPATMDRMQTLGDTIGQPPPVIASVCIGIGLKVLEAQIRGFDPRVMAEAAIEYQHRTGIQPLTAQEQVQAMLQGMASLPPDQAAKVAQLFGADTPDALEKVEQAIQDFRSQQK